MSPHPANKLLAFFFPHRSFPFDEEGRWSIPKLAMTVTIGRGLQHLSRAFDPGIGSSWSELDELLFPWLVSSLFFDRYQRLFDFSESAFVKAALTRTEYPPTEYTRTDYGRLERRIEQEALGADRRPQRPPFQEDDNFGIFRPMPQQSHCCGKLHANFWSHSRGDSTAAELDESSSWRAPVEGILHSAC
jgi:hypothetical protein